MRIVALCSCVFSIVYDQVILTSNTSLVVFFPLKIYHSGYLAGFSLLNLQWTNQFYNSPLILDIQL